MSGKVLFFHNSLAHYRIPLFNELAKLYPIELVITDKQSAESIYGTQGSEKDLTPTCTFLPEEKNKRKRAIDELVSGKDISGVLIPSLDTYKDIGEGIRILNSAKANQKKTFHFSESWDFDISRSILGKISFLVYNSLYSHVVRSVDLCFAAGSLSRQFLINHGVRKQDILVTFDSSEIEQCPKSPWRESIATPDSFVFLYFGRLIERKGAMTLLDAYKEARYSSRKDIKLAIAGSGDFERTLKEHAADLGIDDVLWLGYIDPARRYDFFSQCDGFVLPSHSCEAWGLSLNEAIQCGKPIITTDAVGAAPDLVNELNGRIVKSQSIEELCDAMIYIANSRELQLSAIKEDARLSEIYCYENSAKAFASGFIKTLGSR